MIIQERDIERTVGINTDYISTTDIAMDEFDREFLIRVSWARHPNELIQF